MPSRGNEFFVKVFEKNGDSSSDILKLKKADLENQFSKNKLCCRHKLITK